MPYAADGTISKDPISGGIEITEAQYQAALAGMLEGKVVSIDGGFSVEFPPAPEPPEPPDDSETPAVPQWVTSAQGGIALINFGLMDAVMAVVNAPDMPATHKWAFERATSWERNSPSFNYIADRAGITEQQKDELFIFGASVTP